MKKLSSVMAMVLMAAVVAFPPAALATATLSLSDGNTTVTIADGDAIDGSKLVGVVSYNGPVGSDWWLNVSTGITKPAIGGTTNPVMDLNSVNISSLGGGMLTLIFSDRSFNLPGLNNVATMGIGGTTTGRVSYSAYFDNTNVLGGTAGVIGTVGPLSGDIHGAFSGGLESIVNTDNQFSLTQIVTITHLGVGGGFPEITSFDAKLDVVPIPAPATLLLLGTGLLSLAGWRRFRKS